MMGRLRRFSMAAYKSSFSTQTVARIGLARDGIWVHIPLIARREYAELFIAVLFLARTLIINMDHVHVRTMAA